jgi:hypothetical protein
LRHRRKFVKLFEKVERGFLWEGRAAANGGSCHVNWRMVCRPIAHGGLGVQDMERVGLVLCLSWLWYSRTDEGRAWSGLDLQFSKDKRELFFASTTMLLGNGKTCKCWEDRWISGHPRNSSAALRLHSQATAQDAHCRRGAARKQLGT